MVFILRDIVFYIGRVSKFIRELLTFLVLLFKDNRSRKGHSVTIRVAYNGYSSGPQKDWLYTFVQEFTGQKLAVSWYKPTLIICSSFGSYWLLKAILSVFKVPSIFFSEENLTTLKKYREYSTYLDGQPFLAMGFDYSSAENYRRFPLWLMYLFPPEFAVRATIEDIQQRLDQIDKQSALPKTKFAAMIASHDGYASGKKVFWCSTTMSRSVITEQVTTIDFVNCPGKLLHNDDSLKNEFGDNKKSYLQQFVFNICAENASVEGYVTEKLFEALECGAIPIYWGDKNPEPTILNPQRIIFWDESREESVLKEIKELYLDENLREKYLQQSVFKGDAAQEIYNSFESLRNDLRAMSIL